MFKVTGKKVVYTQVSTKEFRRSLFCLPVDILSIFEQAVLYGEEFGYWGSGSEEGLKWAVEQARGSLSTLEEYFERHPLVVV